MFQRGTIAYANSQTVFFISLKQHNSFVHPGAVQRKSDLSFFQSAWHNDRQPEGWISLSLDAVQEITLNPSEAAEFKRISRVQYCLFTPLPSQRAGCLDKTDMLLENIHTGQLKKHTQETTIYQSGQITTGRVIIIAFYSHASVTCHVLDGAGNPWQKENEVQETFEKQLLVYRNTTHEWVIQQLGFFIVLLKYFWVLLHFTLFPCI